MPRWSWPLWAKCSNERSRRPAADDQSLPGLVDDQPACRALERAILEDFGYEVIEAADAESALTLLRDERVDLLSTGINLGPGMTGIDLARLAREQNPGLKVLFVSGEIRGIERLEPRDRNHFVPKPYRLQDLAQAVGSALANPD